jgi:two-component system, OmpR family, response regulator VicR
LTKILVVEDDKNLRDILEYNLTHEGYAVLAAQDGPEGIRLAYDEKPDLVVLDLMLPGVNGYDVCRAIRKQLTVPILMLSAREDEIDKVLGLELGADDYMTKPFSLRELLARIHAMLRRGEMLRNEAEPAAANTSNGTGTGTVAAQAAVSVGDLTVDIGRRQVTRRGKAVEMKPKEFDLLAFLAQNPQQVFSRDVLLSTASGATILSAAPAPSTCMCAGSAPSSKKTPLTPA